jgi:hypothetical protein
MYIVLLKNIMYFGLRVASSGLIGTFPQEDSFKKNEEV